MSKSGKSPGIVLVNTFCQSSDKYFTGYIGYYGPTGSSKKNAYQKL